MKRVARSEKRENQTKTGKTKEGKSNQDTKGSHSGGKGGKKGSGKHDTGNARRAKDQGVKGPDLTK